MQEETKKQQEKSTNYKVPFYLRYTCVAEKRGKLSNEAVVTFDTEMVLRYIGLPGERGYRGRKWRHKNTSSLVLLQ